MQNVIIIGAGMYVCGRGTEGYGTILPAVFEAKRNGLVETIAVCATSSRSVEAFIKKKEALNKIMGTCFETRVYPGDEKKDEKAYLKALEDMEGACVIISVPDHLHYSIAGDVIEKGRNVMVVKPLAPTLNEAMELTGMVTEKGVYGAVEFHKRFDLANLTAKRVISEGRIGDLLYVNVEYSQRRQIPEEVFRGWASKTNIFQYLAVHYVDIIYFVTGAAPRRAMAVGQKNRLISRGIDTYDAVQALIEWEQPDGKLFVSNFAVNWIDPDTTSAMSYQSIKYIGTSGRYESDQKNRGNQLITGESGIEDINPYFTQYYPNNGINEFKGYGIESVTNFIKDCEELKNKRTSIEQLECLRPTFRQGLVSTAVVEAVNKSLLDGGSWQRVDAGMLKRTS